MRALSRVEGAEARLLASPHSAMFRRLSSIFLLALGGFALPSVAHAQTASTITVRMLDNRTGLLIASSNYLVRADHKADLHGTWITQDEDGTGKLTLPAGVDVISIHATYDAATMTYVNCDADKDHGSAERAPATDHWYSVASIVSSGVVAPNNCVGKKVPEKLQVVAKPGEFVFFVRPMNAKEQFKE
jgi:adhesin HecA-like repeat protein